MRCVTIVISDLHVGGGPPLDDCDTDLERALVEFLSDLANRHSSVELVINGDFLDFAQAPPWSGRDLEASSKGSIKLCFTEAQSFAKLQAILAAHRPIFDALSLFLASDPLNRLVILPGNHDADFFWPSVRLRLATSFSPLVRDRITFCLGRSYRPAEFPRVWIEHGHQYDPLNRFYVDNVERWGEFTPPIFEDTNGEDRLYECIGTRLLVRFLNQLDADYPFVDNVKPFSRFIRIFGASAVNPGYGPRKAAVAIGALIRYVLNTVVTAPGDVLTVPEQVGAPQLLASVYRPLPPSRQQALAEAIRTRGFDLDRPLDMYISDQNRADQLLDFLSDNLDLIADLESQQGGLLRTGGDPGTLSLLAGYTVDETAELIKGAQAVLAREHASVVVMGHTHEQVNRPKGISYLNTGCWTRYYRFTGGDRVSSWSVLKEDSYEEFPYCLNYAEISGNGASDAALLIFKERKGGRR